MNDKDHDREPEEVSPDGLPEETPSPVAAMISRGLWALTAPSRLYADIRDGAPWWQPWVIISIINMIVVYISIPIQLRLAELNPRNLSPEALETNLEAMGKFWYLGVISMPLTVLITGAIVAGLSYVIVSLLAESSSFRKYLTLFFYANIPVSLGLLLGTMLTRMRDINSIRSIADAETAFGPAMLLGSSHPILYPVLSSLDLFAIWFYAIILFGLVHIFDMSRKNALLAVVPLWLLNVLLLLLRSRAAGLS